MEIMSIHRTTVKIPEKALKEYCAPTLHYLNEPILFPNPGVREYQFDGELINICKKKLLAEGKMKIQEDILESLKM